MEKALDRISEFANNPKDLSDFFTTTFTLINLAQRQNITLSDSYFEGVIITTELIFTVKSKNHA